MTVNNDINLVRDLLSELRGGEPRREGPLTLVPFLRGLRQRTISSPRRPFSRAC